jgi:hypothetical protein
MQVLTWSAYSIKTFNPNPPLKQTITATLNPSSLASSLATITNTNHDMFCPGISLIGSGDVVVTGGDVAEKTSIYRVATNAWVPGPNMVIPRGYQSSVTLSTGEVRKAICKGCRFTFAPCLRERDGGLLLDVYFIILGRLHFQGRAGHSYLGTLLHVIQPLHASHSSTQRCDTTRTWAANAFAW